MSPIQRSVILVFLVSGLKVALKTFPNRRGGGFSNEHYSMLQKYSKSPVQEGPTIIVQDQLEGSRGLYFAAGSP